MKLILIRHGETEENAKHIVQGKLGTKLNTTGIEQSKKAGKELKEKHKIDMVFCSPLQRSVDTLNNILDEYPIDGPIFMSKLLEERDYGEYTGLESILIDWEEINQKNKVNEEMGIESLSDLEKRIELFLEDLKLEEVETVLIVSHAGPIKTIVGKLTGKDREEIKIENGEILIFEDFK